MSTPLRDWTDGLNPAARIILPFVHRSNASDHPAALTHEPPSHAAQGALLRSDPVSRRGTVSHLPISASSICLCMASPSFPVVFRSNDSGQDRTQEPS